MSTPTPAISIETVQNQGYYARSVEGLDPEFIDLRRPHSNFDMIDKRFSGLTTLRRIMSQVRKHGGMTMVVEELLEAAEIKQENEDIKIRHPDFEPRKVCRLSFYTKPFLTKRGLSNAAESFLGYAITKEDYIPGHDNTTRIYESVLKPSRHANNFVRGAPKWTCSIAGNSFSVKGYLYAQQNNLTNVCAHVALRTAASGFHKHQDMTYREMNQVIGVDHIGMKVGEGGGGLNSEEMTRILEAAGAKCVVADYTDPRDHIEDRIPFQKVLYGSIESGFPAIVVFQTADEPDICHAIPVFGHTFNEDTWVYRADSSYFKVGPDTSYIPSESWVSMYIAHDDNWGSNFCVPRRYLHIQRYCDEVSDEQKGCLRDVGCVLYVIGTLPQEVQMHALQAEVVGADYLFSMLPKLPDRSYVWRKRLCKYAKEGQIVLRPILLKGKDYSDHLRKVTDWESNHIKGVPLLEPDSWFWMVELSVPELFSANLRKVGEVILRAEEKITHARDFKSFVLARVPGFIAAYLRGGAANPQYQFSFCTLKSHVELYDGDRL